MGGFSQIVCLLKSERIIAVHAMRHLYHWSSVKLQWSAIIVLVCASMIFFMHLWMWLVGMSGVCRIKVLSRMFFAEVF